MITSAIISRAAGAVRMDAHTLMSGIFGVIHLDGSPVPEEELSAMRAAMQEWGPDRNGVWRDGSAGLGLSLLLEFAYPISTAARIGRPSHANSAGNGWFTSLTVYGFPAKAVRTILEDESPRARTPATREILGR